MEMRHKNFKAALELLRRATAEPSVEVQRRVAAAAWNKEPVQMKLHKSLRVWSLYVDLEESLGTLESTRAVYERMLDLRIATPLIIINYACLLEDNKYFEDAFKRYGKTKLERARELFERACQMTPADCVKPVHLQYAKLEEDYGLVKRAMKVYDQATKAVPSNEKLDMYEIYIARAAEMFGASRTREIYQQAIESGLPEKDVKKMCLRYAELEKKLGEVDRARGIYGYASQFADPVSDQDLWKKWHDFEVLHGNEDSFREMLRIKRTGSANYMMQTHFVPPENVIQRKDQSMSIYDAKDRHRLMGDGDGDGDAPSNSESRRLGALQRIKRLKIH
ncbi:unnamed protein product [Linum trigynum]|uniref:Pre-mRNA-splicing factor Syf1/CRNKL1-like C-terminal HAT-repeats domain-containing protein n=1 Tax=Linum trigynum TaxID=586398 RepID=A0AAV2DRC5_9ROSI